MTKVGGAVRGQRVADFEGNMQDKAAMDAVHHHRETVQPIREETGGSTFKNPDGSSAWKERPAAAA